MRVLVCGASGAIGAAVLRTLRRRGHHVVAAVRHPAPVDRGEATLAIDFMTPTSPALWVERLAPLDLDVVVNCVGILMPSRGATFERVHAAGPIELFRGAVGAGIARIVQVSALGVGAAAAPPEPEYLRSKRCADELLLTLPVDAAVVRPSLVYGPGSPSARLFATLASLPVICLPGRGDQRVQPMHVEDLAEALTVLVERTGSARGIYELGGARVETYREMLAGYRHAQGLASAIWLRLPMPLMRLAARAAEQLPQRVLSRDTIGLLERGNSTARNASAILLGRAPASLAEGLALTPPEPALDLHVDLGRPVQLALRGALAFLWLQTALVSLLLPQQSGVLDLLARCGFAGGAGHVALALSCALNAVLGVMTLLAPGVRVYALQAAAVIGYTLTAAINVPALTIDHCAPLAKNVPILGLVLVLWLVEAGGPRRRASAPASPWPTRHALSH